jgi:hypothetical protein
MKKSEIFFFISFVFLFFEPNCFGAAYQPISSINICVQDEMDDLGGFLASHIQSKDFNISLPINTLDDLSRALKIFIYLSCEKSGHTKNIVNLRLFAEYLKDNIIIYYKKNSSEVDNLINELNPEQNPCLKHILTDLSRSSSCCFGLSLPKCIFCGDCALFHVPMFVFVGVIILIIIPAAVIYMQSKTDNDQSKSEELLSETVSFVGSQIF